jgi:hypothetical protein
MEAPASPAAASIMTVPTATIVRPPRAENHAASVDPSLDLFAEIDRLKREMNAILWRLLQGPTSRTSRT